MGKHSDDMVSHSLTSASYCHDREETAHTETERADWEAQAESHKDDAREEIANEQEREASKD